MAAEDLDAFPERENPLRRVRPRKRHARVERLLRDVPHAIRRERPMTLQRSDRGVALPWRRVTREDFRHKQRERIRRRRRQPSVKRSQFADEPLEARHFDRYRDSPYGQSLFSGQT
jgi:hypothetical protein